MQVFRAMMKYYVTGHVHVSLAVAALAVVTFKFFKQEVPLPFVGFVFCGTLVAYGLINRIGAMNWAVEATKGFVFRALKALFLPLSGALFCYGLLPTEIQLTALVFGVLCLFYIVPLRTTPLRNYAGIKLFVVAFVWTGVTAVMPLMYLNNTRGAMFVGMVVTRFLWVIVLTLPFDIRDLDRDLPHLRTWPQAYGVKQTKIMGTLLMLLVVLISWFAGLYSGSETGPFYSTMIVTLLGLWGASPKRSWWYAAFWVEAIPIFWLGLVWLLAD